MSWRGSPRPIPASASWPATCATRCHVRIDGHAKLTGVRHEGWFNLMHWLEVEYGLHHGSHHLVVSAFGFDLSQRSLMTPLFVGAPST